MRDPMSKTWRTSEKSNAEVCLGECLPPEIRLFRGGERALVEPVEPVTGLIANPGPSTCGKSGFFITNKRDFSL